MKYRYQLIIALVCLARVPTSFAATEGVDGKAIYTKNCAACHQATGRGIQGAFPPLAASAFVTGAQTEVATVLLKGRGGMPDFSASLNDAQIAAVVTYARTSWGNKATPVTDAEVGTLRASLGIAPATGSRLANKH